MSTYRHENQSFLLAVGMERSCIFLGCSDGPIKDSITEYSWCPTDHMDPEELPHLPGFYTWEGTLIIEDGKQCGPFDAPEYDHEYAGTWRGATGEDFDRFGVDWPFDCATRSQE